MIADDWWNAHRMPDGSTVISFPQPGPLLNMNHRSHWRAQRAGTRQWRAAAAQAALTLGPPSRRAHGPSWVQVEIPVPDRRRRDPANLTPITKACVDGLVDAGMWTDDTPEFVTTIEPALRVDRPPKGFSAIVRIILTPRTEGVPAMSGVIDQLENLVGVIKLREAGVGVEALAVFDRYSDLDMARMLCSLAVSHMDDVANRP